jgi:hypothetical protein
MCHRQQDIIALEMGYQRHYSPNEQRDDQSHNPTADSQTDKETEE